jgi:hypothetical protein
MLLPAFAITVVVQFANLAGVPPAVVREAKAAAADVLADIDVTVEWADAFESVPAGTAVIRLTLLRREGGTLQSREGAVLGAAVRTQLGSRFAWVYYERVRQEADRHLVPTARLLACAMAHEIGHLVQVSPGHDREGLMRAVWTAADFRRASTGRLRFAPRMP